jgi:hypothetical protein
MAQKLREEQMRFHVVSDGSSTGASQYHIYPTDHEQGASARPEVEKRLNELMPRIQAMARSQLSDNFETLDYIGFETLVLEVKIGTSKQKRLEFRDFIGWVRLFDDE